MRVLFVCKGNFFRSQISEFYFNKLTKKHKAISAGTWAKKYGLGPVRDFKDPTVESLIKVMEKYEKDYGSRIRKQLTEEMVTQSDVIVSMAQRETIPAYLKKCNKVIYWAVDDADSNSREVFFEMSRQKIKSLVSELVEEIG